MPPKKPGAGRPRGGKGKQPAVTRGKKKNDRGSTPNEDDDVQDSESSKKQKTSKAQNNGESSRSGANKGNSSRDARNQRRNNARQSTNAEINGARSWGNALASSSDNVIPNLQNDLPNKIRAAPTYKDLAPWLELTVPELKEWLESKAFQPIYKRHWERVVKVRMEKDKLAKGPDMRAVHQAIVAAEAEGQEKYTDPDTDKSDWAEVDFAAALLIKLCRKNVSNRAGIFHNKNCSIEGQYERMWSCIIRENAKYNQAWRKSETRRRQQAEKNAAAQVDPFAGKKGTAFPTHGPDVLPVQAQKGGSSNAKKRQHAQSDDDDVEEVANPDVEEQEELEQERARTETDHNRMDDVEILKLTRNPERPTDWSTAYGKYVSIHGLLKHFENDIQLRRFIDGPVLDENEDLATLNDLSGDWNASLDTTLLSQLASILEPTSADKAKKDGLNEAFLDNKAYQPMAYKEACTYLGIRWQRPRMEGMGLAQTFHGWQVTAIHRIIETLIEGILRGILLGDATGLGKTLILLGVALHIALDYERQLATALENGDAPPPPKKPILVIVPPDLCTQWYNETKTFSTVLEPWIYHGELSSPGRVTGKLTKKHKFFTDPNPHRRILITSLPTLRARHGPVALKAHRLSQNGWSVDEAERCLYLPDRNWIHDLSGAFDVVFADEAHALKNPDTAGHSTVSWLTPKFIVMATASVVPNRVGDIRGYVELLQDQEGLWSQDSLDELDCTALTNPYTLPDDHPGAILRMTTRAIDKFVADKTIDALTAGHRLRMIWDKFLIRRTYTSPDPRNPGQMVGSHIKPFHSRKLITGFTPAEQAVYEARTFEASKELFLVQENGTVVWNRKHLRTLLTVGDWLGFGYIGRLFMAETVATWKKSKTLLWDMLWHMHESQFGPSDENPAGLDPTWEMPDQADPIGILQQMMKGAPKVRLLLLVLCELVILKKRKVIIFSTMPPMQLLIHGICQTLGISEACYTADADLSARDTMVNGFTKGKIMVFNAGFYIGSTGLNLQHSAHHILFFDTPPSIGQLMQALGRARRLGQLYAVEVIQFLCRSTFQMRIFFNMLEKAMPGIFAELDLDITDMGPDERNPDNRTYNVGQWFNVDGELVPGSDPRVEGFPATAALSPQDITLHILNAMQGNDVNFDDARWVDEEVEPLPDNLEQNLEQSSESDDSSDDEDMLSR